MSKRKLRTNNQSVAISVSIEGDADIVETGLLVHLTEQLHEVLTIEG